MDEEAVIPQPGDFYGGWVTAGLDGIVKGGARHGRLVERQQEDPERGPRTRAQNAGPERGAQNSVERPILTPKSGAAPEPITRPTCPKVSPPRRRP